MCLNGFVGICCCVSILNEIPVLVLVAALSNLGVAF